MVAVDCWKADLEGGIAAIGNAPTALFRLLELLSCGIDLAHACTGAANRGGLYLTDTITQKVFDYFTITTRNYVHPLTDRPLTGSNVRPILDATPSADIELPMTYPAYAGLNIDIVDEIPGPGAAADRPTYIVEISREQSDFLDLAVTPWNAPPYESVDIWIEHGDKAEADLSTVPLAGNGEPAR